MKTGRLNSALLLSMVSILFVSCFSLDPFLFNGKKIDSYQLDTYSEKQECKDALDSLGFLPASTYREISLKSGTETIAGILVGFNRLLTYTDTVIYYLHGNTLHLDYYWPRVRLLYETKYPVMVIDYRGYGKSTGSPTEAGITEDGITGLNYLHDSLGNPKIILYAYSLGSLIGCELASAHNDGQIIKCILEAPIGSVQTIGQDASYLDLPGSYLTTYTGDNSEKIKNVNIPLLWIHGTNDETLNRETNGLKIWNNYSSRGGYYIVVSAGGHSNLPSIIGYNVYITTIHNFITGQTRSNPLLIPGPQ
jgi:pimeloyl-ACP methyl ester carboxylesterase